MATSQQIDLLSRICTRDEAGRHFTEAFPGWESLEDACFIRVHRPAHGATGLQYSEEHWSIEVTADGLDLVTAAE